MTIEQLYAGLIVAHKSNLTKKLVVINWQIDVNQPEYTKVNIRFFCENKGLMEFPLYLCELELFV